MRNKYLIAAILVVATFSLTSCEMIGDILEVGIWMGVIIVVAIIALVLWLIRKIRS